MLGDRVVRLRGEACQSQRRTEITHSVPGLHDVGGETESCRSFVLGDNEPPSRSETTNKSVAHEALEPLVTQRGDTLGEAEVQVPHNVSRGLLGRLRLGNSALYDAFSEIHLEIDGVHMDEVISAETAQNFDDFDPQNMANKRRVVLHGSP